MALVGSNLPFILAHVEGHFPLPFNLNGLDKVSRCSHLTHLCFLCDAPTHCQFILNNTFVKAELHLTFNAPLYKMVSEDSHDRL